MQGLLEGNGPANESLFDLLLPPADERGDLWPTSSNSSSCFVAHTDAPTIVLVVVDLFSAVAAILGNLLVIVAVFKFKRLKTVTNIFVVSLAAADFLVGLNVPYYVIFYFDTELNCQEAGCMLRYWTTLFATNCSMLCLVGAAADRYMAILHPLSYHRLVRKKHAVFYVTVVWIYNGVISALPFLGVGAKFEQYNECDLYYSHSKVYVLLAVSAHVLVCLVVITVLYLFIFREAWRQGRSVAATLELNRRVQQEARTARTMALVLAVCLLGFLPYFVVITVRYLPGIEQKDVGYTKRFIVALYFGKSAVNPLVYGWKNTDFKEAFNQLLGQSKNQVC